MTELTVGYVYNEASDSFFISHASQIPNAESLPAQGRFHCTHEIVYVIPLRNQVSFRGSIMSIER